MTAFNIEAYQWLQVDQAERTADILQTISLQLASVSANATDVNFATQAFQPSNFQAKTTDIAINILWFLSLTLALVAALFAILAQQWIRHYTNLALIDGRERACIRHQRFQALNQWLVPQIIMALPVLLQLALFVFFGGLILLLWTVHQTVAIAITSTVSIFLGLCLVTTVPPTFFADCPYKSPLAWAFNAIASLLVWLLVAPCHSILTEIVDRINHRRQLQGPIGRTLRPALSLLQALLSNTYERVSCRSWVAIERRSRMAKHHDVLVNEVIRWTSQTSSAWKVDQLSPCVLDTSNPEEALLRWLAEAAKTSYDDLLSRVTQGDTKIGLKHLPNPSGVTVELLRHACHRAIQPRSDYNVNRSQAVMIHLVLWCVQHLTSQQNERIFWLYLSHGFCTLDPVRSVDAVITITNDLLSGYLDWVLVYSSRAVEERSALLAQLAVTRKSSICV